MDASSLRKTSHDAWDRFDVDQGGIRLMDGFLQLAISGIAMGAVYALVGLGYALIYNASHVVNLAQGEFVMLGGMGAVYLAGIGLPLPVAMFLAVAGTAIVGLAMERFIVEPRRKEPVLSLMLLTIGAGIVFRGVAMLIWDKEVHKLDQIGSGALIKMFGVTIVPQTLWVIGLMVLVVIAIELFFRRTRQGKAILAAAHNPLAAQLIGINIQTVLRISFVLSALLGGLAGVLVTPLTFTSFDVGLALGIKGFSAAIIGGMGNGLGAVVGGLLLGLTEAMGAGYISSSYKDLIALIVILVVMLLAPNGIFGTKTKERV
jgi:branched-chain amino acid transport system permease protein